MVARVVRGLVAAVAAGAALVACAHPGPPGDWTGGPVSPAPIRLTINPSATPRGNAVPTGIVVAKHELILYFCCAGPYPFLSSAWRDTGTGRIVDEMPVPSVEAGLPVGTLGVDPIFGLNQIAVGDGTLAEYGAVRGRAGRIVVRDPGGTEVEAAFTAWTADPGVTIFWVHRVGAPIPKSPLVREGVWEPLAPDRYPLVSAYDGGGRLIADARIRPTGWEQKGG